MSPDEPGSTARSTGRRERAAGRGLPSSGAADGVVRPEALAHRLAVLAHDLQRTSAPTDLMTQVVAAAVTLVPGAQEGSVSRVEGRRSITSEGVSGDLPRLFDRLQVEVGEGPCLRSAVEHLTVRVDDFADDGRWPRLAPRALAAGVRSALCLQLFVEDQDLGALNLLSREPRAFDAESEEVGLLLAAHAAVAVADLLHLHGVRVALAHRDLIGQAKGVLMERHKVTAQEAFDLLVRASQQANRKLVHVAEELVTAGAVDALPRSPGTDDAFGRHGG